MKTYSKIEMTLVEFTSEDVMTTSNLEAQALNTTDSHIASFVGSIDAKSISWE